MAVHATLTMALDFPKWKYVQQGTTTWRDGEQWHVRQFGPTYDNILIVTHFDAEGLKWLQEREDKAHTAAIAAAKRLADAQDTRGESAGSASADPTQ